MLQFGCLKSNALRGPAGSTGGEEGSSCFARDRNQKLGDKQNSLIPNKSPLKALKSHKTAKYIFGFIWRKSTLIWRNWLLIWICLEPDAVYIGGGGSEP